MPTLCKFIFCIVYSVPANAQQRVFTNQQLFTVDDGLPQSYISGITQDMDGFLWVYTLDGIARFDGRNFRVIRYKIGDSTGLRANTINNVIPRANNSISLFYEGTMADDFNMQSFKVTPNNIRSQFQKIPQAMWKMGNGYNTAGNWYFLMENYKGIGWVNDQTGKISYANRENGLLQQDTVMSITEAADGRVYVVSANGIHISNVSKNKFDFIQFKTGITSLPKSKDVNIFYATNLIEVLPGNRLAMLSDGNVLIMDISRKTSYAYKVPEKPKTVIGDIPWFLKTDSNGQVYFAYGNRIFLLSNTGELKLLWENLEHPQLHISAFFIDRSDVLWVSVNAQGLLKIDLQALPFESYKYTTSFIADIMEMAGANRAKFPPHWVTQYSSYFFRQAHNDKGELFATYNFYDKNQVFRLNKDGFQVLPYSTSVSIFGAMLILPNNELWVFDEMHYCWYRWKSTEAVPERLQMDSISMKGMQFADAKFVGGYTWMSTYAHGLLQYDGVKLINRFTGPKPIRDLPRDLTEICPDPIDKDKFWIGSRGGGLILWDVKKGLQKVYTTNDGLPNNTIYCILPDKDGKIWCSTNKGIFRLDAGTGQVNAFEKADGLAGNEFNRAHKFTFADGRLAFGGMDGFSIFDPLAFNQKKINQKVPIQFTALLINNELQDVSNKETIIKEPLNTLTEIKLPYDKNYLRIEFAALVFNKPNKIKYRYQLTGADKEWMENGTNNQVSYTALSPGTYTFKINATDNNGLWSSSIRELRIEIMPPFWFTWWAYIVYALVAYALVRRYIKFKEQRLKSNQNLAFEKREALRLKENDEMKDRFFNNITHEFRTPLTLIMSPLEKLSSDTSLSAAAAASVKTAQKNSRQLLKLINELLDFSKLNNGQMKLKTAAGDFNLFVTSLVQQFEESAKEKNINFSFTAESFSGHHMFDEEKWEKIINNLLSNALKFTPRNGKIAVLLSSQEEEMVRLEVNDNGPGIPANLQQKIFDRFYQVDDSAIRNYGGTGIGLSLVQELTHLMHGSIKLKSEPGYFTSFVVEIPLQKAEVPKHNFTTTTVAPAPNNHNEVVSPTNAEAPVLMIVEDNDELRAFLAESMQQYYRVITAADGLQAWDIILSELPDVIISDVMMPGQDGFDLCLQCKNDHRTAHIGFILLTSKAAHEAKMQGLKTGADSYITKPFSQNELELRVVNLLKLQQKLREYLQTQLLTTDPQKTEPVITDPFLIQLYKEMDAKIDDAELGVDYLCKVMAMSRSTLNRKLKSLLDLSTNDVIRQYRLQNATILILGGQDITTAAYSVGFSSPSYFTQCFKEQYGVTPSEYLSRQMSQNR